MLTAREAPGTGRGLKLQEMGMAPARKGAPVPLVRAGDGGASAAYQGG